VLSREVVARAAPSRAFAVTNALHATEVTIGRGWLGRILGLVGVPDVSPPRSGDPWSSASSLLRCRRDDRAAREIRLGRTLSGSAFPEVQLGVAFPSVFRYLWLHILEQREERRHV
jgi:hypothetical protein